MSKSQLTIFTTCKPFDEDVAHYQSLAIESWRQLGINVILIGREEGVSQIAEKFNCIHIKDVKTSDNNIPFVDSLFEIALVNSSTDYLCYLNADIVIDEKFLVAFDLLIKQDFTETNIFMTARRKTIPFVDVAANFNCAKQQLKLLSDEFGLWDSPDAIDMFLFNRDLYDQIPDFEIGRMQWDNWLLNKAVERGAAIVDGTEIFYLKHPFHEYKSGINDILSGESNQSNWLKSQGKGTNLIEARNYIFLNEKIISTKDTAKEPLNKAYTFDDTKELKAFLFYMQSIISKRSDLQLWEDIRCFLWRAKYYFPFNECLTDMRVIRNLIESEDCSKTEPHKFYPQLENSVSNNLILLLEHCRTESKDIVIWGTGEFSRRLNNWMEHQGITISFYLDNFTSLRSFNGKAVKRINYLSELPKTPFIIIASMFYREIELQLKQINYELNAEYTF